MVNIIDKINLIIDKIGKRNFILAIFVLVVAIVGGLYGTFSLFTSYDSEDVIDGLTTYKFILNADNTTNSITIAAGSSKYIALTISNPEKIDLKYGVYYSSTNDITNVNIGYLETSEHTGSGIIPSNNDYIITVRIDNDSSSAVTIVFGVTYGLNNDEELVLPTGKTWLSLGSFVDSFLLSDTTNVTVGDYVSFAGNNGCSGDKCEGENANYVSDSNMGYCYDSSYKFSSNGWRVAYIASDTAYLISGGAVECTGGYGGYIDEKSSSTSSSNAASNTGSGGYGPYLFSDSATFTSGTFTLGTTTSYSWPTNASSLVGKYTCKSSTSSSCSTLYYVSAASDSTSTIKPITLSTSESTISSTTIYSYKWDTDGAVPISVTDSAVNFDFTGSTSYTVAVGYHTMKSYSTSTSASTIYAITNITTSGLVSTYTATQYDASFGTSESYTYVVDTSSPWDGVFATSYTFDKANGTYTLNGTASKSWNSDLSTIKSSYKYTCKGTSTSCSTLYEIASDSTTSTAYYYTRTATSSSDTQDDFVSDLNTAALKYCNSNFAYEDTCDANSAWAIGESDFQSITGSLSDFSTCSESTSSSASCGYGNTLIDNGGFYWFAGKNSSTTTSIFQWNPKNSLVGYENMLYYLGLRPVLRLKASTLVVDGEGTYSDPYIIEPS